MSETQPSNVHKKMINVLFNFFLINKVVTNVWQYITCLFDVIQLSAQDKKEYGACSWHMHMECEEKRDSR